MVPPENLKINCVPAEYPDDPADSPQPSHRQISGRCLLHGSGLSQMLASDLLTGSAGRFPQIAV
jgi:hypothetical protein